jgi:ribosomal protein S27AE
MSALDIERQDRSALPAGTTLHRYACGTCAYLIGAQIDSTVWAIHVRALWTRWELRVDRADFSRSVQDCGICGNGGPLEGPQDLWGIIATHRGDFCTRVMAGEVAR